MLSITPPPILNIDNNINNNYRKYNNEYIPYMNTLTSRESRHILSFRKPPFEKTDIFEWLQTEVREKQLIGSGTQSDAYTVTTHQGSRFILRMTPIKSETLRESIRHEMKIYEHMFEHPDATQYISNLLYADCPTKQHGSSGMDTAYFVFEYVEGLPLDTFLRSLQNTGQRIRSKTAEHIQTSLSNCIAFLERIGVVHRDIKPANLFLDTTHNRILLFDFETSCFAGDKCKSVEFVGTAAYATEEALRLQQIVFPAVPYTYTHADDRHAAKQIMDVDISPVVYND